MRTAVINPGSSSWWLLTLSPFLYYERIRISPSDIESIKIQEGISTYNYWASRILSDLEKYSGSVFIIKDPKLPPRGKNKEITKKSEDISDYLINAADTWSLYNPTIVKPGELKNVMVNAYKEWTQYIKYKTKILNKNEPLYNELKNTNIPKSENNLLLLKKTHARNIPELLENDPNLKSVFVEIIRNALLLLTVTDEPGERIYDVMSSEYLPAVELVERYRIFVELQMELGISTSMNTLLYLYNFQLRKAFRAASNKPIAPDNLIVHAFKERKNFSVLRKRLSELDTIINNIDTSDDTSWIKDIIDIAKALNNDIENIDKIGKPLLWASRSYMFTEIMSHVDNALIMLIKILITNPLTTKATIEGIKNVYLSKKRISGQAATIISVARDFVGAKPTWSHRGPTLFGAGSFEFWV